MWALATKHERARGRKLSPRHNSSSCIDTIEDVAAHCCSTHGATACVNLVSCSIAPSGPPCKTPTRLSDALRREPCLDYSTMRTDNLWRRCPLTTHAVWIFAKRLSFCKGIRGLWFRMPTYNMSCVSPHEPCEGQDVLVHHIQQTSAGKACAASSQGNRAHSKPSDADRTAGTCGSITRYQDVA